MSIASEITRLQNAKSALATSIGNKGVTVPASTKLDGYSALVDQIQTGGGGGEGWQRPSEWPDYSKIPLSGIGSSELYMTYDCRPAKNGELFSAICLMCRASGGYTVERGYIGTNGFVAVATNSLSSAAEFREQLPIDEGDYVVYRIKATNNITEFKVLGWSNYVGSATFSASMNPCVEMYGKLEYVTTLSSVNIRTLVSFSVVLKSMTSMDSKFLNAASLEIVDTTQWNTSSVTSFRYMFVNCVSLKYIDASNIDTSSATTLQEMFANCTSLESLDVSDWDTSKVTTMEKMFNGDMKLMSLDVSKWKFRENTSVGTYQMFYNCMLIKELRFDKSLTYLNNQTFSGASFCVKYVFESITPPTLANTQAFQSINALAKIYVPDDSVNAYKTASNWSTYASCIYPISDLT